MSHLVKVPVKPGLGRHIRAGHPWVFKKAIENAPRIPPGSVVDLTDDGRFCGRGYWDPYSAIAVRVLTTDPRETVDGAFFERKVKFALASRQSLITLDGTNAFRLIHGEGDGLPGVIVDLYDGWAVMKLYSAGLTPHRPLIVEALSRAVPGLKGVVGRDEVGRDDSDVDEEKGNGRMLWGPEAPRPLTILERNAKFLVDVYAGQKTGFFLDQRENRYLLRRISKGLDVLNCFCFSGGFSVNAALGGAKSVFSVDQDADAIALARENFTINGLNASQHDFLAADAFDLLDSFKKEGRKFDLIVLDPPAFAKSQKAVEGAIAGYASLNRQALAVLKPGGILCTASCSARVSSEAFFDAVKEGAYNADVELAMVEERYQPPDHPIRLQFREGRYLKFFVLRAV
ncbi:MAG: class I SAM-dependent rRNA methyltransferase [Archangium gephyra]|uniref:Class I SAM-dependent rRNA methyltransferase n=1 Tax=Archangium gephyra TaxID=48 RepID=A0A2W5TM52_9BACT|nr:MAG: class I SAM-dependent rRNA methyltransferase [Archangium gephyra]